MAEQSWADGYVVDVGYVHGFYGELAPASLAFAALLGRIAPPAFDAPFTYYELGCGQGETSAVLAAANPQGRFTGVDFNPTHIHHARALARDAGLDNLELLEKSFAELVALELPDADVVALHGVWSWVSAENRAHIVEFIRRRLKPGGLALVSYNALPGMSQVAPLQRLLADHAASGGGEVVARIGRAVGFAQRLEKAGSLFFAASPVARQRLAHLAGQDPRYLAHEYFNASWAPFYHADVARELGQAKLGFAGPATTLDSFNQFLLRPEAAKLVAEAPDRTTAETIKDFARNCVFRSDLFTRGAPQAAPPALEATLDAMRFSLARPRAQCRLSMQTTAGEVKLDEAAHAPVLEALARGPASFRALLESPEGVRLGRRALRQSLFGLAALGNVAPALSAEGEAARRARTARFNAAALARPAMSETTVLASPVLGSGVPVPLVERLFLASGKSGDAAVSYARTALSATGMQVRKDLDLESRAARFFDELLPYYRKIGTYPI